MLKQTIAVLVLTLALGTQAIAVGAEDLDLVGDPDYRVGNRLIKEKDYGAALPHLQKLAAQWPQKAEAQNLLGFTHRKLKNYPAAKQFYDAALAIDPSYRPAIEYQGMWFIEMGDMASARGNLEKLRRICAMCEETADLEKAITTGVTH
ncbi:MAG: tetratricopeptide repeat protein [Paracoccaceae bacterium]